MMEIALLVLWYLAGVSSFVYWWTKDHDLTGDMLMLALLVGLFGPIAFLMGYNIHGNHRSRVLLRRRK